MGSMAVKKPSGTKITGRSRPVVKGLWTRRDSSSWMGRAMPLSRDGALPVWAGLEFMAQSVAACRGRHLARTGGSPRGGYLVGTRNYRCAASHFPAGAELEIRVELIDEDPSGLCAFRCAILEGGQVLAEALLKVMER